MVHSEGYGERELGLEPHRLVPGAEVSLPVLPNHTLIVASGDPPIHAGPERWLPRRVKATDEELDFQGCYFTDEGEEPGTRVRWRVLETKGVFFYKKMDLHDGRKGCLVVAHYNVDEFGDEAPGDFMHDDVELLPLDKFASYLEPGGGVEWV